MSACLHLSIYTCSYWKTYTSVLYIKCYESACEYTHVEWGYVQGPFVEFRLAPPTSSYPSSGAPSSLLIGPFPIIRHIQSSVVVRVLLSSISCFLCTHRTSFNTCSFCLFSHLALTTFWYHWFHNGTCRKMEENEEVSGRMAENRKQKLRRMSSRTSTTSVISAAEPSPETLPRKNSKKYVDHFLKNMKCIFHSYNVTIA